MTVAKIIQINLDESTSKEIDKLMYEGGIETQSELISTALSLLQWVVIQRKQGKKIYSFDDSNVNTLDIQRLNTIKIKTV